MKYIRHQSLQLICAFSFIGDIRIQEKDFGRIQIDRLAEMQKWARNIKKVEREEEQVKLAKVAANNHYAGLGPGSVNIFRDMWDQKEVETKLRTETDNNKKGAPKLQTENSNSEKLWEAPNENTLKKELHQVKSFGDVEYCYLLLSNSTFPPVSLL